MARQKAEQIDKLEQIIENSDEDVKKILDGLIKDIEGMQYGDTVVTTDWVSTGIKSLNFLLSGDVDKGLPNASMTVLAGESGSGKSFLAGRIASNAQKKGYLIVWLDTEFSTDTSNFLRIGLDPQKLLYKSIDSAEELQNVSLKLIKRAQEKGIKLFVVLDSLGNLMGSKEKEDAENDKMTSDMGQRAKNIRTALRHILHNVGRTKSIFLITNHVYIQPSFIPQTKMSGGMAAQFLGNIILFLVKLKGEDGIFARLRVKSKKNREFIEGRTAEFELHFQEGVNENDGIMDLFKEFNVVEDKKGWLVFKEKSYRESDLLSNEELLKEMYAELTEKTKDYGYHSFK